MTTSTDSAPNPFADLARAIRAHIGFNSNNMSIDGGGRYIRYSMRDTRGQADYRNGTRKLHSIGATTRGDAGQFTYHEYVLPTPLTLGIGTGVTAEIHDFRLLVAALAAEGLRTNDQDFPGESQVLTNDPREIA